MQYKRDAHYKYVHASTEINTYTWTKLIRENRSFNTNFLFKCRQNFSEEYNIGKIGGWSLMNILFLRFSTEGKKAQRNMRHVTLAWN